MEKRGLGAILYVGAVVTAMAQSTSVANPYIQVMEKAWAHAKAHGAAQPVLSPVDSTVLNGEVPLKELQAKGFKVVPWTTNDPEKMRTQIRMGIDGLITDRPDLLQQVLKEERANPQAGERLKGFDVSAHRGGRGLRPENTLPSFESGLDQLSTTLETDTGVSTDGVSLIWHDQFYSPLSCRYADGSAYNDQNRVFLSDISSTDAQKRFICDKIHSDLKEQKNDLALSPVSVAFAKQEGLMNPYVPTYVAQLFRFVDFYVEYYRTGAGKSDPHAKERADNASRARFNIETKIMPEGISGNDGHQNHTVGPQQFVTALGGAIAKHKMESRAEIQSFDFRTLILFEEQYPKIPTYYLTGPAKMLTSPWVPESLRATAEKP
jgi:glycerophosphoryl diester phosphodiesterase